MYDLNLKAVPAASDVNYSDSDEICGYRLLLCKMFERAGGFSHPLKTSSTIRMIQAQGLVWLKEVRRVIDDFFNSPIQPDGTDSGITLNDISDLLGSYDFFYRVCNGSPCFDYLRKVRLKTADRWIRGDKSASQTYIALGLLKETDRDIRTMERKYTSYAISIMGNWIDELCTYRKFRDIPAHEAYDRLTYLINTDLLAYFNNEAAVKAKWIKSYMLSNNEIDALDTATLWSYIGFAGTVAMLSRSSHEEQDAQYVRLFSKLAGRPDLNPYYREALEIDLAQYQTA